MDLDPGPPPRFDDIWGCEGPSYPSLSAYGWVLGAHVRALHNAFTSALDARILASVEPSRLAVGHSVNKQ